MTHNTAHGKPARLKRHRGGTTRIAKPINVEKLLEILTAILKEHADKNYEL